jgi:hypothetical protein
MMHAFSLVVGSLLGHPWARSIVKQAQQIVTFFRASHLPNAELEKAARLLNITTGLVTSNKTRFNSVYNCMKSLIVNRAAFHSMDCKESIKPPIRAILNDKVFWKQLQSLTQLLEPFSAVITSVQGDATTMADVHLYWLFLARNFSIDAPGLDEGELYFNAPCQDLLLLSYVHELLSGYFSSTGFSGHVLSLSTKLEVPWLLLYAADFLLHCATAFNNRAEEMDNPLCRLALFLHPLHKGLVLTPDSSPTVFEDLKVAVSSRQKAAH